MNQNLFLGVAQCCMVFMLGFACQVTAVETKFPSRPIRFIVPFVPGAGTDITARTVALKMADLLAQQIVVDNRPGAAGNIGLDLAAKSPPDGYTVTLVSATHTVNYTLQKNLPYDLIKDFAPISQVTSQPYCLTVNAALPARSLKEMIELIKNKPNYYTYGSSGSGGLSHLAGTLMSSMAKVNWIHVPYKGGAAAINDMLGGQIHSLFATIIGTQQHVKAGRLRWLAVSMKKRSPVLPDMPTMSEAGLPGYDINGWYGILAPAATPKTILDQLNHAVLEALKYPEVGPRFATDGSEPAGTTRTQFTQHILAEVAKHAKLIKEANIKLD